MLDSLGGLFGGLAEVLKAIPDAVAGAFKWLIDLVVDAITGIGNLIVGALTTLLDGIIAFLTNPLCSIVDGFKWVIDFLGGIVEAIGSEIGKILKALFVPSDDYFDNQIKGLQSTLSKKLNTQDYEDLLNSLNTATRVKAGLPNLTCTIFGQKVTVVDMSWYADYQQTFYGFVRGTMFVLLIIYNLNMLYKLVRKDELSHKSDNQLKGGGN